LKTIIKREYWVNEDTIQYYNVTLEKQQEGKVIENGPSPMDDFSFQYRVGRDDKGDYMMNNYAFEGSRNPITENSAKYRRAE